MTITQTINIPADRRVFFDFPCEVPTGKVQVELKVIPFEKKRIKRRLTEEEEIAWINENIEWLNKEAIDNLSYQCWNPLEDE